MEKKIGDVDKKIPDTSGLVISTVLNTKISEIEIEIPDTSGLMTTAIHNTNFSEGENKISDHANDRSQNMFVYQPALDTLELKKDKGADYFLSWKPKGVYNSKFKPLYTDFLPNVKYYGFKIGTQFSNNHLVLEQSNYLTKIENVYIVCDLDAWPINSNNN